MKFKLVGSAALLSLSLFASPGSAQDAAQSEADLAAREAEILAANQASVAQLTSEYGLKPISAPADGCELHVWPAARMTSMTTSVLGGGLLDTMLHSGRDANNKTMMASALDSVGQLDALIRLDLRRELSRPPGTAIVLHSQPLDGETLSRVKTRRSESQSMCYSELIVEGAFYLSSPYAGRSLRTDFRFRDFGDDQIIDLQHNASGGNGLDLFPPKEGEDAIAAFDELTSTFQANFQEYANNARKKMARRSRR